MFEHSLIIQMRRNIGFEINVFCPIRVPRSSIICIACKMLFACVSASDAIGLKLLMWAVLPKLICSNFPCSTSSF